MELEVQITAEPAAFRAAIGHLGVRERATLHRLHDRSIIDLRDHPAADIDPAAG